MDLRLSSGDRVCIVGGGPAGSMAALHLLTRARARGLRLEVLIFEPRDFSRPGPGGCNRCAGILSSRLVRGLEELDITLPGEIIQARIHAYAVHLDDQVLQIEPPVSSRGIFSVYRGGGPRLIQDSAVASFDAFLLARACELGARHVASRVRSVGWDNRPVVETARESIPTDLLVMATGVNSRSPLAPAFRYRPPATEVMAQDEFLRPATWPGDRVDAFFSEPHGLTFGAVIPKGRYLNVSLLGKRLTRDAVSEFIEAQNLRGARGLINNSLCGCTPRIATGPARGYFGDRWVTVGDASVTRYYKDGIGSAFYTAKTAMQVAMERGISRRAFKRGYAPYCRRLAVDNQYGKLLFSLWNLALRNPLLLDAYKAAVRLEDDWPPERRVHIRILWGMFTGDELYRDLFRLSLSPAALKGFFRGLARGSR